MNRWSRLIWLICNGDFDHMETIRSHYTVEDMAKLADKRDDDEVI